MSSSTQSSWLKPFILGMMVGAVFIIIGIMFALYMFPAATTETTATRTVTVPSSYQAPIMANPLPVVTAEGLTSDSITLGTYMGQQPVLIEFMVSWCGHCQNMVLTLEGMYDTHGQSVQFISVAAPWRGANADTTAQFIRKSNPSWTHVFDAKNEVFTYFGVDGTPTFLLFNSDGELIQRIVGEVSPERLSSELAALD